MARMHQTTVRFGADLWAELEREARAIGVSVAQYVRDAAMARVNYAASRRGDDDFARALDQAIVERQGPAQAVRAQSHAEAEESEALWAQGRQQAPRSATELHEQAEPWRGDRAGSTRQRA